jgi:hypothetical protein
MIDDNFNKALSVYALFVGLKMVLLSGIQTKTQEMRSVFG